jgi:ActR/RegA family two-component response regulator
LGKLCPSQEYYTRKNEADQICEKMHQIDPETDRNKKAENYVNCMSAIEWGLSQRVYITRDEKRRKTCTEMNLKDYRTCYREVMLGIW